MWPFNNASADEENRHNTRSQPGHLLPPLEAHSRRGIGRGHSRSPSPSAATVGRQFTLPPQEHPVTMASAEQLQAIKDQLREEMRAEMLGSALSAARDPDVIRKKPEIPAFDKDHVEIWIKRMENAYIRAGITSVKEKFAFLETKFAVNVDPVINEFFFVIDPSENSWRDFLNHLRKEYGPTPQQKASIFVDGFKRDGRRPSQYAAALNDKTKDVTLDDIKKEMMMREIPVEIRRMLQERIEKCSFKEAAEIADAYFDRDGQPRHRSSAPINEISEPLSALHLEANNDDTITDANAITGRSRQHPKKSSRSRSKSRNTNGQPPTKATETPTADNELCFFHDRFGDKARNCHISCPRFDANRFPGNARAGRK